MCHQPLPAKPGRVMRRRVSFLSGNHMRLPSLLPSFPPSLPLPHNTHNHASTHARCSTHANSPDMAGRAPPDVMRRGAEGGPEGGPQEEEEEVEKEEMAAGALLTLAGSFGGAGQHQYCTGSFDDLSDCTDWEDSTAGGGLGGGGGGRGSLEEAERRRLLVRQEMEPPPLPLAVGGGGGHRCGRAGGFPVGYCPARE